MEDVKMERIKLSEIFDITLNRQNSYRRDYIIHCKSEEEFNKLKKRSKKLIILENNK